MRIENFVNLDTIFLSQKFSSETNEESMKESSFNNERILKTIASKFSPFYFMLYAF